MVAYVLGAAVAALIVDRALGPVQRGCARFLPDDAAGPDGWLVDTKRRTGIFD
ncbi:MAG: hypothetical protein ACU0CO_05255 [Shimia sp.]